MHAKKTSERQSQPVSTLGNSVHIETSQAPFPDVVNYTHEVVVLLSSEWAILSWNASAERQYGWKRDEVLGKNLRQLLGTHFPVPIDKVKSQLEATGQWEGELVHACRDGQPLTVQSRWVLRKEFDPPRTLVLEVNTDIAERKRIERRLRRVYESDMIGIAFLRMDGSVTEANDYYLKLIGYSREELAAGKVPWENVTPPEYRHAEARAIEQVQITGFAAPWEQEFVRKDGTRVPVLIGISAVEGAPREGVACVVNLSERKRLSAELTRSQERARSLSTPVLQVHDRLLIVPMIGVIDDDRARQMTTQLLEGIRVNRARVVVLDVTGVPAIDEAVANYLVQAVQAARLLGTEMILTGVSREIAHTLVELGSDFGQLAVMGDLQSGIEEAESMLGYQPRRRSAH
jgi:PAS domain S-box-containing protein